MGKGVSAEARQTTKIVNGNRPSRSQLTIYYLGSMPFNSNMNEFAKDTDGFFARHFDRKISGAISRALIKTSITPNQITCAVTALGLYAGWLFSQPGKTSKVTAAFLFLLTSILDGCDGEVARAKHMTSSLGGWLDLWGDNLVHIVVFGGMALGFYRESGSAIYLTLGKAAVAGTLISATLATIQMIRKGRSSFTSVAGDMHSRNTTSSWRRFLFRASDALARRDFVYVVPVLAIVGWLPYFLWACAIGVMAYSLVLVILFLSTTP